MVVVVVVWADEAVGSKGGEGFIFFWKIKKDFEIFIWRRGVVTHQTAAGLPAGHVCLTTGSESSPLLA